MVGIPQTSSFFMLSDSHSSMARSSWWLCRVGSAPQAAVDDMGAPSGTPAAGHPGTCWDGREEQEHDSEGIWPASAPESRARLSGAWQRLRKLPHNQHALARRQGLQIREALGMLEGSGEEQRPTQQAKAPGPAEQTRATRLQDDYPPQP